MFVYCKRCGLITKQKQSEQTCPACKISMAVVPGKYLSASGAVLPAAELAALATAFVTAFAVSLAVVRFLLDFVRRHTFSVFGVYRILLGIAVAIWFGLKK